MSDSDTPNASQPEKPKPEQKELLPAEQKKEESPEMDIPGMGISAEGAKEPRQEESPAEQAETAPAEETVPPEQAKAAPPTAEQDEEAPTLDVPAEGAHEDVLEEVSTEGPKPPDLTPPTPPPPVADKAAPDAEGQAEETYDPVPIGEFIGNQVKDLGLGGQIGLGGSLLCLIASFLWSWPNQKGPVVWFAVFAMLLLSAEAIALVCLHLPDRLSEHRPRMKDLLFIVGGHIVVFSLLALLLGARLGPVLSLVGGLALCAGDYVWLLKSKPAES